MTKLIVLFAVCVTASAGMVRREAPAASPLAELQAHAANFQKTFSEQLQQLSSSENSQQLSKALKDGSDQLLQQFSAFSTSLQHAMSDANGKAAEALKTARAGLTQAADELRAAHPDVEQRAAALKDQLAKSVSAAAQHSQALAKEVAASLDATNKQLEPQIKKAYDEFVAQAQRVQQQLHQAATATAAKQ